MPWTKIKRDQKMKIGISELERLFEDPKAFENIYQYNSFYGNYIWLRDIFNIYVIYFKFDYHDIVKIQGTSVRSPYK